MTEDTTTRHLTWMLVALVLAFCLPMFLHADGFLSGDAYRDNDWLTDRFFDLAARQTILQEGAFPMRSHLIGGGYPTLGQPFDGSWAPTLFAVLLLGPVWGVKLNLLLLLGLGVWGTWRLARDWLGLEPRPAAFAAAAFAVSGWLPSMMLVGFYPQALYMAAPGTLALFLAPRRPRDRILAGALLFLLLQQGGNAFVATAGFLVVAAWAHAAGRQRSERRWVAALLPWLALLSVTAGLAFARRYASPSYGVLTVAGVGWLVASEKGRSFLRDLRPSLGGLAILAVVVATLGIGKFTALAPILAEASYAHADNIPPSVYPAPAAGEGPGAVLDPARHDEHFYSSAGDLLVGLSGRAPTIGDYLPPPDPPRGRELMDEVDRRSATREYEYLGLTPALLLLIALGLISSVGRGQLAAPMLFFGAVGVCMGPHLLPDLHFLLAGGLPRFHSLSQPVKYYNFFILLPAVLLSGEGARALLDWAAERGNERGGWCLLILALLWPFLQNAPIWADRFAEPMPIWSCTDCQQVKQIGHLSWIDETAATREKWSRRHRLRERRRPPAAREYDNAAHGVGTIDWYGTLELPELAQPSHFVTSLGAVVSAPGYRGEAWLDDEATSRGKVKRVQVGSSRIHLEVSLSREATVVINQSHLPGFVTDVGTIARDAGGLLAVRLPAGEHQVTMRYRPLGQILGLLASLVAAMLWSWAFVALGRRGSAP